MKALMFKWNGHWWTVRSNDPVATALQLCKLPVAKGQQWKR